LNSSAKFRRSNCHHALTTKLNRSWIAKSISTCDSWKIEQSTRFCPRWLPYEMITIPITHSSLSRWLEVQITSRWRCSFLHQTCWHRLTPIDTDWHRLTPIDTDWHRLTPGQLKWRTSWHCHSLPIWHPWRLNLEQWLCECARKVRRDEPAMSNESTDDWQWLILLYSAYKGSSLCTATCPNYCAQWMVSHVLREWKSPFHENWRLISQRVPPWFNSSSVGNELFTGNSGARKGNASESGSFHHTRIKIQTIPSFVGTIFILCDVQRGMSRTNGWYGLTVSRVLIVLDWIEIVLFADRESIPPAVSGPGLRTGSENSPPTGSHSLVPDSFISAGQSDFWKFGGVCFSMMNRCDRGLSFWNPISFSDTTMDFLNERMED
jgi:hypothetical protein